jgi:circadian clock protein KaiC
MPVVPIPPPPPVARTGVAGLDVITRGGLPRDRLYLVDGNPGSGKTTLGLQFLLAGHDLGEVGLYITLSETEVELRMVAASHGMDVSGLTIHELSAAARGVLPENQYTVFHPSEVELGETVKTIMEVVERIQPARVVFDSLSELRLLARDALRYRRQILALKQMFTGRHATVLLLDDRSADDTDLQVESLAHGVIRLEHMAPEYGAERRRLRVLKLRGVAAAGGYHDFTITTGGLVVYPRVAEAGSATIEREVVSSGVPELDTLFGGGLDRGTTTLFLGPAGVGKSAIGTLYACSAAERGERSAVFLFDETVDTYLWRGKGIGYDVSSAKYGDRVNITSINPGTLSPGEFIHRVKRAVDDGHARIVIIDSLNGYLTAMPQEHFLLLQIHELFTFLRKRGVLTMVMVAQSGLIGQMQSPVDLSYLADTVVLLRYFEAQGSVRQAISAMKKRSGAHERTIREFRITPQGIRVGEPLTEFRGVLTGVPLYTGSEGPLLERR